MEIQFNYFNAPISNTTPSGIVGVKDVFNVIVSNQLTLQTASIRESYERGSFLQRCLTKGQEAETRRESELRRELMQDICVGYKNKYTDLKASRLPFVTFSVISNHRKTEEVTEFSGLICYDFDKVENVQTAYLEIINETYPVLTFISPSGNGIKAIYQVEAPGKIEEPEKFKTYFYELYDNKASILRSELNKELFDKIDPTSRDMMRACFLCYSNLVYIDPSYLC